MSKNLRSRYCVEHSRTIFGLGSCVVDAGLWCYRGSVVNSFDIHYHKLWLDRFPIAARWVWLISKKTWPTDPTLLPARCTAPALFDLGSCLSVDWMICCGKRRITSLFLIMTSSGWVLSRLNLFSFPTNADSIFNEFSSSQHWVFVWLGLSNQVSCFLKHTQTYRRTDTTLTKKIKIENCLRFKTRW